MTESSESKKRDNASSNKDASSKNASSKKGDKFSKLNDSNHVAMNLDKKRAEAEGKPEPTFKPRAPHKSKKKKCAENKSN